MTSIIIVGGLAAFLVLDEVDADTLTALRVTPVPLSTFFAYRAATVMVVTTAYVIVTISFSGILEPGLVPALIPIGLFAGLSAVVTLLLIVALASNKIQGLAMVRALGRAALPAVVHSLRLEPGLRCAATVLGRQGVLGGQRARHLVGVRHRRRRLQPGGSLAAVPPLPREEHREPRTVTSTGVLSASRFNRVNRSLQAVERRAQFRQRLFQLGNSCG